MENEFSFEKNDLIGFIKFYEILSRSFRVSHGTIGLLILIEIIYEKIKYIFEFSL